MVAGISGQTLVIWKNVEIETRRGKIRPQLQNKNKNDNNDSNDNNDNNHYNDNKHNDDNRENGTNYWALPN